MVRRRHRWPFAQRKLLSGRPLSWPRKQMISEAQLRIADQKEDMILRKCAAEGLAESETRKEDIANQQSYNFEDPRTRTRTESLGLGASSLQFGLGGGALGPEAELDRTRTRTVPHVQVDTH